MGERLLWDRVYIWESVDVYFFARRKVYGFVYNRRLLFNMFLRLHKAKETAPLLTVKAFSVNITNG